MADWIPRNPHERSDEEMARLEQAFRARGACWVGECGGPLSHEDFQNKLAELCIAALNRGEAFVAINGFVFAVRRSDLLNAVAMV